MIHTEVKKVLHSSNEIAHRIAELGKTINTKYGNEELVVVMLLKGALIFTSDIIRELKMPLQIECIKVSSYKGGMESTNEVEFLDHALPEVSGRNVLIVDDILDTGQTLYAVAERLKRAGAKQLERCVLLSKKKKRLADVEAEYVGFEIGDEFVVGYGLDFQGLYRNLPYVGIYQPEEA